MHALAIALIGLIGTSAQQAAPPAQPPCPDPLPPCTFANAQPIDIVAVRSEPAWETKCVRITGLLSEGRLNADRFALLEHRGAYGTDARRSLPLLPARGVTKIAWPDRAAEVEAVGRVQSCATASAIVQEMQERDPDSIIMVSGYCHTSLETYLSLTSLRTVSRRPVYRLTEVEVPPGRRPLVPVPAGAQRLDEHRAAARSLIDAVARGDRVAFARLVDPDVRSRDANRPGPPPAWVLERRAEAEVLFQSASAANSAVRSIIPVEGRQERVFARRDYLADGATEAEMLLDGSDESPIHCWCRAPDCTGRWPVLEQDADNDPARPYVCLRTGRYRLGHEGIEMQASLPERRSGLAEPPSGMAEVADARWRVAGD